MAEKQPATARPKKRSNARERIIDAAITLANRLGAGRISLEAVAEEAGVSKGGLLYHFASKAALLEAMVARHVISLDRSLRAAHADLMKDHAPNALIRAYLKAFRLEFCAKKSGPTGLLVAIAEEPKLLDPVRNYHAKLAAEIEKHSETPDLAVIAFVTVQGIWHMRLFDTSPFADDHLLEKLDRLSDMLANQPVPRLLNVAQAG